VLDDSNVHKSAVEMTTESDATTAV